MLPDPPAALKLPGSPVVQTVLLANALERRNPGRPAALLAAYTLGGVPVMNGEGPSLTTPEDTLGVPWSTVWTTATVANPDARVPLSQVARIFASDGHGFDVDTAATSILDGLRTAVQGDTTKPGPAPVALLVNEESSRAGGRAHPRGPGGHR